MKVQTKKKNFFLEKRRNVSSKGRKKEEELKIKLKKKTSDERMEELVDGPRWGINRERSQVRVRTSEKMKAEAARWRLKERERRE